MNPTSMWTSPIPAVKNIVPGHLWNVVVQAFHDSISPVGDDIEREPFPFDEKEEKVEAVHLLGVGGFIQNVSHFFVAATKRWWDPPVSKIQNKASRLPQPFSPPAS